MITIQLSTESLTASVISDGEVYPDLLDDLSRRCVRLFVEGNASLAYEDPEVDDGDNSG